jgi:hypothetical protein
MPLNKIQLTARLKTVFKNRSTALLYAMQNAQNISQLTNIFELLAGDIAEAVDAYIKTATVVVNPGQVVAVNVAGAPGAGSTTTNGNGKLI